MKSSCNRLNYVLLQWSQKSRVERKQIRVSSERHRAGSIAEKQCMLEKLPIESEYCRAANGMNR